MTDTASNPHVYLPGLALSGYRSFGPNIQFMGPFSQINVFAGPNNVGKSNILRFISEWLATNFFVNGTSRKSLDPFDDLNRMGATGLIVGFPLPNSREVVKCLFPKWSQAQLDAAMWLLEKPVAPTNCSRSWWVKRYAPNLKVERHFENLSLPEFAGCFKDLRYERSPLWRSGNCDWTTENRHIKINDIETLANHCFGELLSTINGIPTVRYVPADRRIRPDSDGDNVSITNYQGGGASLIKLLAKILQPDDRDQVEATKARTAILRFLADVTGDPTIGLSVPHHAQSLLIVRNGVSEKLSTLGTGIHHLVLFAIEAALRHGEIICLEEPEVFLHPILQRKLVEYLKTTSNQYFISTHSAQFLDVPDVAVFHLEMTPDGTKVSKAETSSARFAVCRDLGYRASDIVQANCVVWVEGPSELIYLRKWISEIDPTLRHGIEYSVMFYGGSLSSWLTGDDPEDTEELISLVTINRHSSFVMDSDKDAADSPIKGGKEVVRKSVENAGGFTWVTQGREIENYIPFEQMQTCIKRLQRSSAPPLSNNGLYGFAYPRNTENKPVVPKVKVAKAVCGEPVQWGDSDLKTRVFDLVNYIREANGLTHLEKQPAR